jgi:hypothetical protein
MLMQELAGGQIASEIVDVYPVRIENRIIDIKRRPYGKAYR